MDEHTVRMLVGRVLDINNLCAVDPKEDLQRYGMDSLNYIELLLVIEEYYHITIPEEKIGGQWFHTMYDIGRLIEEVVEDEGL